MTLSIITINYNNATGLEKTIESILAQRPTSFEYLVIDGGSTDDSVAVIEANAAQIDYWTSEPDRGIYHAMNKGIQQATGDYVLFINSGDTLIHRNILAEVFAYNSKADLIYGNIQLVDKEGHTLIVHLPQHINIPHMLENKLPHPVTFIKRTLFDKYGQYREDLRIVSDWAFFLKIIALGRVTQKHIPLVIAALQTDGISRNPANADLMAEEKGKVLKDYFSYELLAMASSYDKYYNFYHSKPITFLRRIVYAIRKSKSMEEWKNFIYTKRIHWIIRISNKKVREQQKNPLSIPILIISYNRLDDLRQLVSFLIERKHENIVIVDNKSTYPPLLAYYHEIKELVTVKIMDKNYGHLVFWSNRKLYAEYASGYYIITDSDIIPNDNLPHNYVSQLKHVLDHNKTKTKVGFALAIDDIPDSFNQKEMVIEWEKQFWEQPIGNNLYEAFLDTTFAMYPPCYQYQHANFYDAIRIAGNFTAKHGGWYINSKSLTDEELFYATTANNSNSWKINSEGDFVGNTDLYTSPT